MAPPRRRRDGMRRRVVVLFDDPLEPARSGPSLLGSNRCLRRVAAAVRLRHALDHWQRVGVIAPDPVETSMLQPDRVKTSADAHDASGRVMVFEGSDGEAAAFNPGGGSHACGVENLKVWFAGRPASLNGSMILP